MKIIKGLMLPLAVAAAMAGCGDILDVENPNNLIEEELSNPTAARSIVNGASAVVARGIGAVMGPYAVATDEAIFVGSRDAWRELDAGNLHDPRNEFTDDAFRFFSQGRWMADEAVERVKAFDDEGELVDRTQLARAYLYAALQYIVTADMFDDFVIDSDKQEAGSAVGPSNMAGLYDQAIEYLDAAEPIATASGTPALQFAVLATRARAKHARAMWPKLQPPVDTDNPLVDDQGAVNDANAALAIAPSADARATLTLNNDDIAYAGEASIAYNVNQRRELNIGSTYVDLSEDRRTVEGIALMDPIDEIPDPALAEELDLFLASHVNQRITYASTRELHLIRAEAALAGNAGEDFTDAINDLRALDGLTPYSGQVPALDLLIHSRQANLFMQGRRLADLYRFGLRSPEWEDIGRAVQEPGTFLPITCIELRGNPNLTGNC